MWNLKRLQIRRGNGERNHHLSFALIQSVLSFGKYPPNTADTSLSVGHDFHVSIYVGEHLMLREGVAKTPSETPTYRTWEELG
jgi:hypothetical protein